MAAGSALVLAGVLFFAFGRPHSGTPPVAEPTVESVEASKPTPTAALIALAAVEVPDVQGVDLAEARLVLEAAGFEVRTDGDSDEGEVRAQEPVAGTVAQTGSTVTVIVVPPGVKSSSKAARDSDGERWVVCIDPGHQAHGNSAPEPVGPGAKTVKPKMTAGTSGVETGLAEYEVVLQISMNLKRRLEKAGVRVVMTRTTNDVNLSNAQRAELANAEKADLFVRVHADGSPDETAAGTSTLYPARNKWTKPITASSKRAAEVIQSSIISSTGSVNRSAVERDDLAGFNYAKVPSVLVESGYLSNPVEDRLLASPHYQDKLAAGIAEGVLSYLAGEGR